MSLKAEIETWVKALAFYDGNDFENSLKSFDDISDTSKILFNCGVIHATLGEHEKAVQCYQKAVGLDQYLAVAYFQQGVSNFLVGDFEEALANFNDTLLYLRGNNMIDYAQLGLMFKLYSCEVLFNRGLCYIYLQQREAGMQDLSFAVKEKVVEDHNVIDDAIAEEAEGYTVFSIPVGVVYRPNASKVKNLKTKDYLGKARLVAVESSQQAFTGFQGSTYKNASKIAEVKDERTKDQISFAATNLVKKDLVSKKDGTQAALQAVGQRNNFPPTPPPENDINGRPTTSRAASVRGSSTRPMPKALNTQTAKSQDRYQVQEESPQRGPIRRTQTERSTPTRGSQQQYDEDAYPEELMDMYATPSRLSRGTVRSNGSRSRTTEDDYASDYDGSFDEGDFEMQRPPGRASSSRGPSRTPSRAASSTGGRGVSRRPEVRKIRVKVHAEDIRYIMITPTIEYIEFVERVKDKFALKKKFKLRVRDDDGDGDMITMSDQDDLDMAIQVVLALAKREQADQGKMEIWVIET